MANFEHLSFWKVFHANLNFIHITRAFVLPQSTQTFHLANHLGKTLRIYP